MGRWILSLLCPERTGEVVILSEEWIPFLRPWGFLLVIRKLSFFFFFSSHQTLRHNPNWYQAESQAESPWQCGNDLLGCKGAPQGKLWPREVNCGHPWAYNRWGTANITSNEMISKFQLLCPPPPTFKHLTQELFFTKSFLTYFSLNLCCTCGQLQGATCKKNKKQKTDNMLPISRYMIFW